MSKFWELLGESVIGQIIITVLVIGGTVYLAVTGQAVPEALDRLAYLVVGFYFGAKGLVTARGAAKRAVERVLWEGENETLRGQ